MANRFYPVPRESVVTSQFGPRWGTVHRGLDFGREGGSAGMAVYAAQAGTVVYSGAASGFGGPDPAGWLVIDHPTEAGSGTTVYGHIIREVNHGARVEAGQRIGRVNPNTATNGGVAPHLHFEVHPTVWRAGSQIDPAAWLAGAQYPDSQPGRHRAETTQAVPSTVSFGVDVSEHQDGMSLLQASREGMEYAIIRTTDGTYKDRVYRSHVDDARRTDMVLAAYHYLRNPSEGTTVDQQVRASLEVMGDNHRLPIWLDVETPAGIHVDHIREAHRLYREAGIRVIGAYSYVPYWEGKILPGEPDSHEFGAFWVAAYGANRHGSPAQLYPGNGAAQWNYPLGNQRPVLWQFGSNARVAGFNVDINAFRGTREQVRALFYGEAIPATVPAPVPVPSTVTPAPLIPAPDPTVEETPAPATAPAPAVEETPEPVSVKVDTLHVTAGTVHISQPGSQALYPKGVPGGRSAADVVLDWLVSLIVGKRP